MLQVFYGNVNIGTSHSAHSKLFYVTITEIHISVKEHFDMHNREGKWGLSLLLHDKTAHR